VIITDGTYICELCGIAPLIPNIQKELSVAGQWEIDRELDQIANSIRMAADKRRGLIN
jgi:hypothetical protein